MNTIFGLVFAYLFFVKKKDIVRPSTACETLFGERLINGWLGKLIDVLFIVGFVCGVTTCIGVNFPTIIGLVTKLFGFKQSLGLSAVVIMSWPIFMALLLYTGLKKGVKFLSDFRVYFGFGILAVILLFGPTSYILSSFTDSFGLLMQNFVHMSLYTDPYYKSGMPQGWAIFYWAWYFVLQKGIVPIADILAKSGQGDAIVAIWSQLSFAGIMLVILLVYGYIAMQTLLNGATVKHSDYNL